jgi:small subunit ribosomal protein S6
VAPKWRPARQHTEAVFSPEEVIRINQYEIMLMIEPDVAEERHTEIIERIKKIVTDGGGEWVAVDPWGKRKLAYEIDHLTDAWYYVVSFDSSAEALDEVTRVLAITDGVMRHMATTRLQNAQAAPSESHEPAETTG